MQKDNDEDRYPGEPEDDVSEHVWSPSGGWSDAAALVAELEPRRYRMVPVVPASHGGPPAGTKREHQAGRRHEADEDCSAPGLVRRLTGRGNGLVHAFLGFLLRHAGPLRH